jgi:hypothetical protein
LEVPRQIKANEARAANDADHILVAAGRISDGPSPGV